MTMVHIFLIPALIFLLAAFVVSVLVVSLYIHIIHVKYSHLPQPKRLDFYAGHLRLLLQNAKQMSYNETIRRWSKEFGPLYVLHFYTRTVIICTDSAVIKELLTRSKYLKSPDQYRSFRSLYGARTMGKGLVSELDHQIWMKKRALFNPAFHRKYLTSLMEQFNVSCDKLIAYLTPLADGKTEVTMLNEFGRLTMEIIAKVGFGMEDEVIQNPDNPLCKIMPRIAEGMQSVYRYPFIQYSILPRDIRFKREVRCMAREMRALGRRVIENRIAALKTRDGNTLPNDILTYILQESDNMEGLKDFGMEDMIDEFCTFFAAGQETTANHLAFTLLHLGQNPAVMSKLRKEIESVVNGRTFVEYSDVMKLQYLTSVLKESLRMNPPVGILNRLLPSDAVLCGYSVPKGSTVLLPVYGMGRNEKHFADPERFDPDRFSRGEDSPLFAYFPFSLGARSCIGQTFAMIESKVVICKLIQMFDFTLLPGQSSLDLKEEVTLKPRDGCKTHITPRTC